MCGKQVEKLKKYIGYQEISSRELVVMDHALVENAQLEVGGWITMRMQHRPKTLQLIESGSKGTLTN